MHNYSKDGIVVSTVLDSRTINKEGKYPVKIKVYYQRKPKYYSTGICMTKQEWEKLPESKSSENRKIKQAIESSFSLVRINVEALAEKGYNPVNQIVGYIMSGDPTYITSHKNARSLIMKVERDELIEEAVKYYINNKLK